MKRFVRFVVRTAMATVAIGAVTGTAAMGPSAEAATYVSTTYTAPKKGQTNAGVKALQLRLVKAKTLEKKYVTSHFGRLTEQAVKKFQRSHQLTGTGKVTRTTWNRLVAATGAIVVSQPGTKIASRCRVDGHVLCVDKTTRKLYYLESGRVVKTLDARFGCAGMRTREGTFTVRAKSRHHVSTIYHTPMPYAMFFSGGQAVHYSADFAARGYAGCSHGCVNIRNRAAIAWIFDRMHTGDRVVVYRS